MCAMPQQEDSEDKMNDEQLHNAKDRAITSLTSMLFVSLLLNIMLILKSWGI